MAVVGFAGDVGEVEGAEEVGDVLLDDVAELPAAADAVEGGAAPEPDVEPHEATSPATSRSSTTDK